MRKGFTTGHFHRHTTTRACDEAPFFPGTCFFWSIGMDQKIRLKKELGLLEVYCLVTGSIIGAALFLLLGLAHSLAGYAMILSYMLAAFLVATAMFSMAELVSAMPKSGADYFVVKRVMGPAVGTITGLLSWFFLALKGALALYGISLFIEFIVDVNIHLVSIALAVIFITINYIGVKEAGRTQVVLTISLICLLVYYIFRGFWSVDVKRYGDFAPHGFLPVIYTTGFIFVTFGGILKCVAVAEEIKNPGRTIPMAMILSLVTVAFIYVFVVFVTAGILDADELHKSNIAIIDGSIKFMGRPGILLMSIAGILACVTTANGGIMAASRYPLALSDDGLLPPILGRIHKKFHTPHVAILTTGIFVILSLFLNLEGLAKVSSTVLILTYIVANLCLLIMRESKIQNYNPSFRAPLYPWLPIIGIIGNIFIIFQMGMGSLLSSIAFAMGGFLVYWYYGRIRTNKESALMHLIERVMDKQLGTRGSLESELKGIIHERDGVIKDRFDNLIEKCTVIDLEETMDIETLYARVAEIMSSEINIPSDTIYRGLLERERETTTVVSPTLAIPHIIIEGNGLFDIALVRSRAGIRFSDDATGIHTVFVLLGTKDERNFHLRALSSIAQIVQDPNFDKKWMAAKNDQALRDIILLGKRKRQVPKPAPQAGT